jgi:DNA repair exonuclease SbcCD ATPase subunit
MNRISLLYKMDGLLEQCKPCKRPDAAPDIKCKGCNIYSQLREIGNQLGRKKEMPKLTFEVYQDLKAQGLKDVEIAKKYGLTGPALAYHKKKWSEEATKPADGVKEVKAIEILQEDKTAEYERIMADLKEELSSKDKDIEQKNELIQSLQQKIQELENLNAACDDVENELASLREENEKLLKQKYHNDYVIENQKHKLKELAEENDKLAEENKALKILARRYLAVG